VSGVVTGILLAIGLVACLTLGGAVDFALVSSGLARTAYDQQLASILDRYHSSTAALSQLLAERDANPGLVGSADWLRQDDRVVSDLQSEYAAVQALAPPAGAVRQHACIADALRLTSTGATMLHDGFLIDGHGAYYFGSHGNWDLNLGALEMQQCQRLSRGP
jgi:hypothetical protein